MGKDDYLYAPDSDEPVAHKLDVFGFRNPEYAKWRGTGPRWGIRTDQRRREDDDLLDELHGRIAEPPEIDWKAWGSEYLLLQGLVAIEAPEPEWQIEGLVPFSPDAGTRLLISGPPKAGKSRLMYELLLHITTARQPMGNPFGHQVYSSPAILINEENTLGYLRDRASEWLSWQGYVVRPEERTGVFSKAIQWTVEAPSRFLWPFVHHVRTGFNILNEDDLGELTALLTNPHLLYPYPLYEHTADLLDVDLGKEEVRRKESGWPAAYSQTYASSLYPTTKAAARPWVVFDTIGKTAPTVDWNDYKEVNALFDVINQWQRTVDVNLAIVHHSNKGQGKGDQRVLGSQAIAGWYDAHISLTPSYKQDDWVKVEASFREHEPGEPFYLTFEHDRWVRHENKPTSAAATGKTKELRDYLESVGMLDTLHKNKSEVIRHLKEHVEQYRNKSDNTIRRYLDNVSARMLEEAAHDQPD